MADHEALVTALLEETLESGVSPEEACKDSWPEPYRSRTPSTANTNMSPNEFTRLH